ncbi:hypothetical protein [Sphingopyxis granuli]|uniref:hypothetical protein n=1 Tax=Sphingopyxis granuli TaxID=267128 RepID=UPI001BAE783C|nr:hypothetical protein [Sphingopyxis granuli]QUM70846.1 hypothetical protein ICN83_10570 [Sphingopyxis granuli]
MTVYKQMLDRAYAEFDRLVEDREIEERRRLASQGRSREEIDLHIAACRENVAKERIGVGRLVATELQRAGVPLDHPSVEG